MEGIGIAGDWDRQLFQGNELISFKGYNTYDFNLRHYDPWQGRFTSLDPVDIYGTSPYAGMMNNPAYYTDPNGDCPICFVAIIGGAINLGIKASQGQINSWQDGFAAFGIGAAAGTAGFLTGGAAFAAAGGGAAGAGGLLAGIAGGAAGAAVSSPIQGLGNAAYFGDPYSLKTLGRDIAFGGAIGGVVNGAISLFSKTPGGAFRNVFTGDRVADGATRFSLRNGSLLRQQGWTKGLGGRWSNTFGGDLTFSGVEQYGTGSLAGNKVGDVVRRGGSGGTKLLQRFNSVESVIENAGKLERLKGGVRQGFIQGYADDIFKGLSQQYGTKIQTNGAEMFFQSGNIRVGLHGSVRGAGIPTLHINNAGQLFKIRITR